MRDFEIKRTVFLHNRSFKPGQEKALEEAGYTQAFLKEQVRRGSIAEIEIPLSASDGAIELAEANDVDLREVEGSGPRGRIYKTDVEEHLG